MMGKNTALLLSLALIGAHFSDSAEARGLLRRLLRGGNYSNSHSHSNQGKGQNNEQRQVPDESESVDFNIPQRPEAEKEKVSHVGSVPGRWIAEQFQFQSSNGVWTNPSSAYIADKDGVFLNKDGDSVSYTKGDILFEAGNYGWYKADKDSPQHVEISDVTVPNPSNVELSLTEKYIVHYTNIERMKRGLPALAVSQQLQDGSREKSLVMAKLRKMSHGVTAIPNGVGENIAWNQANAAAVVRTWINSPGHRANMLSRTWTKIGVAEKRIDNGPYWTQQFSR